MKMFKRLLRVIGFILVYYPICVILVMSGATIEPIIGTIMFILKNHDINDYIFWSIQKFGKYDI